MPELPEVETIVRGLQKEIIGQKILSVKLSDKKLRQGFPKNLESIVGSKINNVERRSKYILIRLNAKQTLVVHLGMSGKLMCGTGLSENKHDHVRISLGNTQLVYNDPRRFGLVTLVDNENLESNSLFKDLGIEPLSAEFNFQYLKNLLERKTGNIKSFLMNAKFIVGVGNIYASESLFYAGIHPLRKPSSLADSEIKKLVSSIKNVLLSAIKSGGSTLRDYVRSNGDVGGFQHEFSVYGKKGVTCKVCDTKIESYKITGRSTFFCSTCQR